MLCSGRKLSLLCITRNYDGVSYYLVCENDDDGGNIDVVDAIVLVIIHIICVFFFLICI